MHVAKKNTTAEETAMAKTATTKATTGRPREEANATARGNETGPITEPILATPVCEDGEARGLEETDEEARQWEGLSSEAVWEKKEVALSLVDDTRGIGLFDRLGYHPIGLPARVDLACSVQDQDRQLQDLLLGLRQEPETVGPLQSFVEERGDIRAEVIREVGGINFPPAARIAVSRFRPFFATSSTFFRYRQTGDRESYVSGELKLGTPECGWFFTKAPYLDPTGVQIFLRDPKPEDIRLAFLGCRLNLVCGLFATRSSYLRDRAALL
jgi:hypothetical protein